MSKHFDAITSKTIIDFKPVSPEHGDLFGGRDPVDTAVSLEAKGVFGLSVVTETQNFGGSLDLLRDIAGAVSLPVLRKDFINTEDALYETYDCGARDVLLISSYIKDRDTIGSLHDKALSIGLRPVVEVHNAEEMAIAGFVGAKIIGINNRDISLLEKDGGTVETTLELIKQAPKMAFIISESGIRNREDAQKVLNAGAGAVLVGTAYWHGHFEI